MVIGFRIIVLLFRVTTTGMVMDRIIRVSVRVGVEIVRITVTT